MKEAIAPWRGAQNYLNFAERNADSESFYLGLDARPPA